MGRLIVLILIIAALVLIWKAFGPSSWKRNNQLQQSQRPVIKGPDDDEEFLWELEKRQFKERRARQQELERQAQEAEERRRRERRQEQRRLEEQRAAEQQPDPASADTPQEQPEDNPEENPEEKPGS
ncbi:hypothetical protein [Corynebacterium sp. TAE3-ERU2]|uniref:hypothetical protein n=1 Tax=Corynebacterium sp. TAE3-ERU2 TaxID=2849497 RepID=UPI001C44C7AD|nr:hypothetical protein [Corynebacterium sp. TAE3-ERU2]